MEALWNRVELERPPNATCRVPREEFDTTKFMAVLETATKDLKSQELLFKEAALLSRQTYRMKTKFRNDKGVKTMSKVNKTLLKYLSLSLEKEYENLKTYIEQEGNHIKLPTKQMIEYVLVRTQGFAKLMSRVEEVSKHSAHFLKCRINLGHAWGIAIIGYAIVSRIWILSRHLTKRSCTWYNDLYQYLKFFKLSGLKWLPNDYELPSNLEEWLALPWIYEPTPNVPNSYGLKDTMFKLIVPHESDSDENLVLDVRNCNEQTKMQSLSPFAQKKESCNIISKNESKDNGLEDDAGEFIDRDSFNTQDKKEKNDVHVNDPCKNLQLGDKKCKKVKRMKLKKEKEVIENKSIGVSQEKNYVAEQQNVSESKNQQKLLTFDSVKNKKQLIVLLSKDSYPGLDKLRWNMIRKKSKKLIKKLDTNQDERKQSVLVKKVIKRVQCWIA